MNRKNFKLRILILLLSFFTTSTLISSCIKKEAPTPVISGTGDYFPLTNTSKWHYLHERFDKSTNDLRLTDSVEVKITGDTILLNKSFKKISGTLSGPELIRKEGSEYFGVYYDSFHNIIEEYKFFDEELSVNSSWTFNKIERYKIEYTITAKGISKTVNGIEYKNVIEVAANHYFKDGDDWKLSYTVNQSYAKGIGEIYTYYPYHPFSYAYPTDLKISLLSHKH